jgi:hypothetical protein
MKTYNYQEVQQDYSLILKTALKEDVFIRRKNRVSTNKQKNKSPFEVAGINTNITKQEIIDFVNETRKR